MQSLPGHVQQVIARLPLARLEIGSRAPVDEEDFAALVHDHAGGGEAAQQQSFDQRRNMDFFDARRGRQWRRRAFVAGKRLGRHLRQGANRPRMIVVVLAQRGLIEVAQAKLFLVG